MLRCVIVAVLASCAAPDSISAGVSQRFETFDQAGGILDSDYSGQQFYISGTWQLKPTPMVLSYSPDTKLFLANDSALRGAIGDPTTVHVNTPKHDAPKGVVGEVGDLLERGKNADGDYTLPGVLALLVVALLATVLMMLRSKPKDTP